MGFVRINAVVANIVISCILHQGIHRRMVVVSVYWSVEILVASDEMNRASKRRTFVEVELEIKGVKLVFW